MKKQVLYRPLTVGLIVLSFCLLVISLLTDTALNAGVVEKHPRSPVRVDRILPKSTAAYNGIVAPATKLYAPWLLGRTSALRLYNAGNAPATVWATFTSAGGVTTTQKSLAVGAIGQIEAVGAMTGTQMAAIITSTQPIAVVINDFGLDGTLATSYAAMSADLGGTFHALPSIFFKAGDGWESKPIVQNVGAVTTSVTIVYTRTSPFASALWVDNSVTDLAPGQVHIFDPETAGLPDNFFGAATITSDEPVVVIVYNGAMRVGALYPEHGYVYRVSLPHGDDLDLYYPMLVNGFKGWTRSEILFLNGASTPVDFALDVDGQLTAIPTLASWHIAQRGQSDQLSEWVGAARVSGVSSLYSLVWLTGEFLGDSWAAYTPSSAGARTWYLPFTDQQENLNTYVAVQNLMAGSSAQITLTYHNLTGTEILEPKDPIAPFKMGLYATNIPDFVGGVVVEADQPVMAIAVLAGQLILDKEVYLPIIAKSN